MLKKYKRFLENIYVPKLRLPKNTGYTDYKNITKDDIEFDKLGDDGQMLIYLGTIINKKLEEGVALDIQLINQYYQIHIDIHESLRGQGLSKTIYEKFLLEFGHIYSSYGRRMNKRIDSVLSKFKNDDRFSYIEKNKDILIIYNENPDINSLVDGFMN